MMPCGTQLLSTVDEDKGSELGGALACSCFINRHSAACTITSIPSHENNCVVLGVPSATLSSHAGLATS
jgi:hypothetical protein